ncbi:ArsR/SmtB family transcription factor [Alicyclobacillus dauci]|uniref:Metalloregulator ArsR/SmtB family transcription factor n=1 Tax=Alicyclobacillus dauci TaxID=1475485 RepID=A0ABY6Z991_9BACL|nr:metalloregulator ArsR/SmtB family transcription factor [Alicyclobacillus dauci]WAH39295.1 metalloregulator ArsR/SmtB family transcription factor [Alicyclobacillus dauci]
METGHVEAVLAALADPTRRQLLDVLATRGEATATLLATHIPVSRQAIVKHLTILSKAGLVSRGRTGREMRYSVYPEQLNGTARWMADLAAEWDKRLASIKRLAEMNDESVRPG